jgi:hypothetical protein
VFSRWFGLEKNTDYDVSIYQDAAASDVGVFLGEFNTGKKRIGGFYDSNEDIELSGANTVSGLYVGLKDANGAVATCQLQSQTLLGDELDDDSESTPSEESGESESTDSEGGEARRLDDQDDEQTSADEETVPSDDDALDVESTESVESEETPDEDRRRLDDDG